MSKEKPTILFTLIYAGEEHRVQTYEGEYYSLMTLISDYLGVPGFGLCCGMGSCGTCLVEINKGIAGSKRTTLSCGIPVDDDLANAVVVVTDSGY